MAKYYSYHSPKKRRVRTFMAIAALVILLLVGASVYIRHLYLENLEPVSGSNSNILVTIPTGSSLPQIADILKQSNVIKTAWAFEWYVRNDDFIKSNLEAGTYDIHPNQSVQDIVAQITEGKAEGNLVVILPGQRIDQIESALIHDGFSKTDVTAAMMAAQYQSKYPMLSGLPAGANLEGFLYPDSFAKDSTTPVNKIINESLTEMQSKLTTSIVAGMSSQGLNTFQGVTLASIVEQEVNNASDRQTVSQVFLSRIKNGMNLGSDVTADYGAILAGQKPSVNYDSPYNTRLHPGLPPGPISNVSASSLYAVAHPSNTNYLYFVTGDNGKTYFSTTLDVHNQQIQQYCKVLCSSE